MSPSFVYWAADWISVRVEGVLEECVDCLRANERLHVLDIVVLGILGAGAGPEKALGSGSVAGESLKAFAAECRQSKCSGRTSQVV